MNNKELLLEFNQLSNDVDKWRWVKDHQDSDIIIQLDNDDTFGYLPDSDDEEDILIFQFDNYIGNNGSGHLLSAWGIRSEYV